MSKFRNPAAAAKSSSRGTPIVVLAMAAAVAFVGYFIGYITLVGQHPIHWGMALGGGVVGWLTGKLIYRLRGETDII